MMPKSSLSIKILTVGIFAALAVIMVTSPLALTMGDNTAFARSDDKGNDADQGISEEQYTEQDAQCVSGESIVLSCNNIAFKDQSNEGNSALGQKGGDGRGDSNDADQDTSQGQYTEQDAQCVSGEEAIVSCNNAEFQDQVNSGKRVLAQD